MVCLVSFEPVHDSQQRSGGANEAVIRMLISIGRLVVELRDRRFTHEFP